MLNTVLAVALLAAPEMIPPDDGELLGRSAPDVAFTLPDGKPVTLKDYKGKPVVLSFWASWCGPCRKELPALSQLAAQRTDVTFLAVNVDKERAPAAQLIAELKLTVPVVYDPEAAVMARFDVVLMPTMFLLDKNGTVKLKKTGFAADNGLNELTAALGKL